MRRRIVFVVTALALVALLVGTSIAMADKPTKPPHSGEGNQLIPRPNGFPAGPHYNLNIHGKKVGFACNDTPGGGSVFVPEYGPATIEYVSNRKGSLTELMVLDPCAGFDGDPAKVQLPYEAEGYYVYGRILGKPDHGKNCTDPTCPSKVILYPNVVTQACNDTPVDPNFGNYTSCDEALLALGFILSQDVYVAGNETYIRFDPGVTKGKGKSKATDITALFTYVGWVVHPDLDIGNSTSGWCGNVSDPEPDGQINDCDVPADASNTTLYPGIDSYDINEPIGSIDIEEWLTYQSEQDPPMAWYFSQVDGMWIFNIADLVVTEQGLVNDGTKLLQIRFYPKDGTTFEE
jgi:hypothetical protein